MSEHPHTEDCQTCRTNHTFNAVIGLGLMIYALVVGGDRGIVAAILCIVCNVRGIKYLP